MIPTLTQDHSPLMGRYKRSWQDSEYTLSMFSCTVDAARTLYRTFVESGIAEGKRKDLTGGGFVRSNKGWRPAQDSSHRKGDERILGSSDFVLETMKAANETWERNHALKVRGINFASIHEHVAHLFNIDAEEIFRPGKYRTRVAARSVFCYFLVRDLGMTATAIAEKLGIGQRAVSISVARGEDIVRERGLTLPEGGKVII